MEQILLSNVDLVFEISFYYFIILYTIVFDLHSYTKSHDEGFLCTLIVVPRGQSTGCYSNACVTRFQ